MKKIKLKKRRNKLRIRRKIVLTSTLVLLLVVGIGYSFLSADLHIFGNITVKKYYGKTLYEVLEREAEIGTYAKEYTGDHHDSFTEEPSKNIYHWNGIGNSDGTLILNKNNVIFADHCWQMLRTTDTGGVKLVYNGEVENNQCLDTRGNHVGYNSITTQSMATTYYYGTSYNYDKTNNVFSLDGTITTGTIQTGQYTCKQTTSTGTCSTLYLVSTLSSGTTYNVLQLTSNSHYSQFGDLQFNKNFDSLADVGYMYNTRYDYFGKNMASTETLLSRASLNTNYWYAHSVVWGNPVPANYNLVNAYQVSSENDYPDLVGEYTFISSNQTYTNNRVNYITSVDGSNMYYITLTNSENHTLSDVNYTYTYGDSYTDNGNGTYTINNATTIYRSDWSAYSAIVRGKYVCKDAINNTCSDMRFVTDVSRTSMTYTTVSYNYKYAKNFIWDGNKYILSNDSITFWNIYNASNLDNINNYHYTCWNLTGECTTLSYIYYVDHLSGTKPLYINLTDGKSVEDALGEMLSDNNVNQIDSTIKTGIDAWYKKHMMSYTSELEDTIFCNDRSIKSLGGWDPNGGSVHYDLQFNNYSANPNGGLSCANITDRFSVSNNKAKLTYPVGMLTLLEMKLLNNSKVRKTGQYYLLMSPYYYDRSNAMIYRIVTSGNIDSSYVYSPFGVRPVISLKPGTKYLSGTGSMSDPYVVDTNS